MQLKALKVRRGLLWSHADDGPAAVDCDPLGTSVTLKRARHKPPGGGEIALPTATELQSVAKRSIDRYKHPAAAHLDICFVRMPFACHKALRKLNRSW